MDKLKAAVGSFYANYFNYQGRSSLGQYWWVTLYLFVAGLILSIFLAATEGSFLYYLFIALYSLFTLANIIPGIMLSIRRLHDIGKGGGWIFINFIPFIGQIWFIVLMLQSSQGPNRFGNGYVK